MWEINVYPVNTRAFRRKVEGYVGLAASRAPTPDAEQYPHLLDPEVGRETRCVSILLAPPWARSLQVAAQTTWRASSQPFYPTKGMQERYATRGYVASQRVLFCRVCSGVCDKRPLSHTNGLGLGFDFSAFGQFRVGLQASLGLLGWI